MVCTRQAFLTQCGLRDGRILEHGLIITALELDEQNGNDLWRKAIEKEMTNIIVGFNILENGESVPV